MPLKDISPFFDYWRTFRALDREVIDGVVAEEHRGPSGALVEALRQWPGIHYWSHAEHPGRLVLIRPLRAARRERWLLHTGLFLLTFFSVWVAGSYLMGVSQPLRLQGSVAVTDIWASLNQWAVATGPAFGFAATLMGILLVHELGHYVLARRYHIDASPPYFLPAPWQVNFIGTFGAFIRLRSPILDRRQLLDVGAAGPWAGLVLSVIALLVGLGKSEVIEVQGATQQFIYWGRNPFFLGDSLLLSMAREWVVGEGTVLMHPLALAGWFGVFVTMLNLLPLGQLDGGHIVYALIGRHQAKVGMLMWYSLVLMGFQFQGWWVWAALILLLGRGRIAHPSVIDDHRPIPRSRWVVGALTAVLFAVTFTADPLPSIL